jgi:uncharacterized protein (DUF486 family)
MCYPKKIKSWIINIVLCIAIPLIYYLATPNNFVGSKRYDIKNILIIYLV